MYYRNKLKNSTNADYNSYNKKRSRYKEEPGKAKRFYLSDIIVKAVATGIFLFSIALNIILIAAVILMSVSLKNKAFLREKGTNYTKEYIKGDVSYSRSFVVIDINGIINEAEADGFYNVRENMVDGVKNRLKLIAKDPAVKGVILLVNSPGGTVTASDMIYHEIIKFKKETSLPVVTYIKDIGASGAYYIASSTDYIMSYPTAITGSIGVIMYNFNFKNLMDKYGVRYVVIKSGKHKDLMSPFKEIDKEEIKWMQGIVNELLDRFIGVVKLNRKNLSLDQVRHLADGRVYTATMAKKEGLIDDVGTFDDVLGYLQGITNIKSYSVYRYVRQTQLGGLLSLINKINGKSSIKNFIFNNGKASNNSRGIKAYYLMGSGYGDEWNGEIY